MLIEIGFIFLGLLGVLMRRNLIGIGFCFQLTFLGILLWIHRLGADQVALILGFVLGLFTLLYSVVVVFVWRHKGTLHLDEIRELLG